MTSTPLALFVGLDGLELSADEAAFLRAANPYGVFLFRRNIDNREQLRRLCAAIREALGRADAPIFIDQEGGRVQRLDNGNWPSFRSLGAFGALARRDLELGKHALRLSTRAMGAIMADLTIDSGTTPVVDLARTGTHDVIGQRAFGDDPALVIAMANPASVSPRVLELIRSDIGYDGVLITDCLSMEALKGTPGERVAAALAAGNDIALVSQGGLPSSDSAAAAARPLSAESVERIARGERKRGSLQVDALALYAEVERIFEENGLA